MLVTHNLPPLLPGHPFPTAIVGFSGDSRCHAGIARYICAWGLLGHVVPSPNCLDVSPKKIKPPHAL